MPEKLTLKSFQLSRRFFSEEAKSSGERIYRFIDEATKSSLPSFATIRVIRGQILSPAADPVPGSPRKTWSIWAVTLEFGPKKPAPFPG